VEGAIGIVSLEFGIVSLEFGIVSLEFGIVSPELLIKARAQQPLSRLRQ
jgi:hypothetical protein